MSNGNTPEEVLASILATGPRPQKVKTLEALNELCKAIYEVGPRDFSKANVARLCDAKGIMTGRALYNPPAADYVRLLDAWQHRAGPLAPKLVEKDKPSTAYVKEIQDPVLRMLVQRDLATLARVTSELNTLKSKTTLTVDRRPLPAPNTVAGSAVNSLEDSELRALKKAISPEYLKKQGWAETKLGEIVNDRNRTIFDPGFATGLRKLLGES